ncbi:MAG TPA: helix-turn-helix domain-containing protein, partial [Acidimicrobiales bacterium]|nr:helix-turn-helix domain-containing protein [Acidimicrobiales bacterium]
MSTPRLDVLKALGDNTRYAIYLELARAGSPRSTADISESLDLHPNTVRPHLERMREVGLLAVEVDGRGSVGRPQHRYALAPDAPSLGLEPPAFPLLARMLAPLAAASELEPDDVALVGAEAGRAMATAGGKLSGRACVEAVTAMLSELGFDPAVVSDDGMATIAFTHCPFAELAAAHPEVVCHLHRGLIEGYVEQIGGASVERFGTLADRDPCQVELAFS